MKKLLFGAQVGFFCLFNIALLATVIQLFGQPGFLSGLDYKKPVYNKIEEFDPTLVRLNNSEKLIEYCDSIYEAKYRIAGSLDFEKKYSELLSSVISKRFFHGYSHYTVTENYLSVLFSRATLDGYSAIVIPEDILKHPNAACSQQSIVMMEVLKKKKIKTRKIGFKGKISGHFCFEVYYNNSWHFYDTNMEPDAALLNANNRPAIEELINNKELLLQAYQQYSSDIVLDVFSNYSYGIPNTFAAPRGIIFQRTAKVLSYTLWIFFLVAFVFVRKKYLRLLSQKKYVRNSRVYFPQPEKGTTSTYYPGIAAPGT